MPEDLTKDSIRHKPIKGITEKIRRFLWQFPSSSPKEVCRILGLNPKKYSNMISVEKTHLKKWMEAKIEGRLPKPLASAHRVEWTIEEPLSMVVLMELSGEAEKCRPGLRAPKPVGKWYVIPNRNNMREYHDEHVTVRVFPKSGTVRILPGHQMAWPELKIYVERALFLGGIDLRKCEKISETLVPSTKHKTFRVGPTTPFKIDYYRDSLGITIRADGSHPEHIEVSEDWPSWIKPQLKAISEQTQAVTTQTQAITALTKQISLHLKVMKGINKAVKDLTISTDLLRKTLTKEEKPKPFSLKEWLHEVSTRYKS